MNTHHLSALSLSLMLSASLGVPAIAGDIVAIRAPDAGAMTKDQVAGVFLGRSSELRPVDLPESSVTREIFY